ncbi:glucosyltransferase domain-containing protein [Rhodanobacter sp. BL-MT-08]
MAILLPLYFLILYPILRANRFYNDDLKRALVGHTGWDSNGRPLTTLLMRLLQCYDSALVDVSPLTQVGAVAVLAWVGVLVARRYTLRSPWLAALLAFPIGAQPFYLENLSYKFDALSMSVAIWLALLPLLSIGRSRRGWWLGVLALFGSLAFYQPAINLYLVFMLLDVALAQLRDEPLRPWLRELVRRVLQIGVAVLTYQLVIGIHIHGWVGRESQKIHSISQLPLVETNIASFYRFIESCFDRQWWNYFLPLLLVLAAFPIIIGVRYAVRQRPQHAGWLTAILLLAGLLMPLLALLGVAGPMLMLLRPELEPRVMMGVGALLSAGLILMQAALAQWRRSPRWTLAAGCMLAAGMCVLASAYGNALGEQKAYEDRIASSLADDLVDLKASHGVRRFLLDGNIGFSPITQHVAEEFPMINLLIAPYIDSADRFHTTDFLMYFVDGVDNLGQQTDAASMQTQSRLLAEARGMPAIRTTSGYSLRIVDDVAVVTLHSAPAQAYAAANRPAAAQTRSAR